MAPFDGLKVSGKYLPYSKNRKDPDIAHLSVEHAERLCYCVPWGLARVCPIAFMRALACL